MSEKRRDCKGRLLRNGEVQRKDGMYMFRYTDPEGARRTIYSWKLVDTDKPPEGKRSTKALRDMERAVQRDLEDEIRTHEADRTTVNQMFEKFLSLRTDLRETTRCNYAQLYDVHIRNLIGHKALNTIRPTSVQRLYMDMLEQKHLAFSTIQSVHSILYQIFEMAVLDNVLRTNPTESAMRHLRRKTNTEQEKRHALTEEEQAAFIDFVYRTHLFKRYGPLFTVLLGTGMRIGEALGLRWCDCDLDAGFINVNHALVYKPSVDGGYEYRVTLPKTEAGNREIPMFDDVREALKTLKGIKRDPDLRPFVVGEYTDFVFLNSKGKVWSPGFIFDVIQRAVKAFNKEQDEKELPPGQEALHLPRFSAHILRHTFCTRFCEHEDDLKIIQEVMGHKNIRTTMDVYNEATKPRKAKSFKKIEGKFRIA